MSHPTQPATAAAAAHSAIGRFAGLAGLVLAWALLLSPAMAQDAGTEAPALAQPISEAPAAVSPVAAPSPAEPPASLPPVVADQGATPVPATSDPISLSAPAIVQPAPADAPAAEAPPNDLLQQFLGPELRSDLPHNLSPWGMFMAADWVVKSVMIGLALASLLTWTIWLAKTVEIACARARIRRALTVILASSSLAEASRVLSGRGGPAAFMVRSAEEELRQSAIALDYAGDGGVKERLGSNLARIEAQAGRRMSKGTGALATIGSTAPFVGLFGTVWGIMNAFIGISEAQTTNLAIVAPGIAEALLATAIGLVAAIPAVVVYNVFARSITGYRQLLTDAATGVERLVSRDLDYAKVPATARRVG